MLCPQLYRKKYSWWLRCKGWVTFGVGFHFGFMRVIRHRVPPGSSWVFIKAEWMTTEYTTWLKRGILGKSWNFGLLNGTKAVRFWLVPQTSEEEEESLCAQRVFVSVRWCQDFGASVGSWPRTMTGLQHQDQAARLICGWNQTGSFWALQQIWHNWVVQFISQTVYLISTVSVQCIYLPLLFIIFLAS